MIVMKTRTPPRLEAQARRPVHILRPVRLSIDAGVALLIEPWDQGRGARQRIPLGHILRIVLDARSECPLEVLVCLMQHGICVQLQDARGHNLGHVLGRRQHALAAGTLLESALADPHWPRLYREWKAERAYAMHVSSLLANGIARASTPGEKPEAVWAGFLHRRWGQCPRQAIRIASSHTEGEIAARLMHAFGSAGLIKDSQRQHDLVQDFLKLTHPALCADLLSLASLPEDTDRLRSVIITHLDHPQRTNYQRHTACERLLSDLTQLLQSHWG